MNTRKAIVLILLLVLAVCREPNLSPSIEAPIAGPQAAIASVPCSLSVTAIDPDLDVVALRFNWGDGDTSGWSSPIASGDTVTMGHAWTKGKYEVRAQARDERGRESEWSAPHNLTVRSPYPDSVVAKIDAEGMGEGSKVVLSTDGAFLYVAGDTSIQAVRTSDNAVCGEILVPAPHYPYFLAISPDGQRLYFSTFDDTCVFVARTSDFTIIDSILLAGASTLALTFHPSGDRVYLACYDWDAGYYNLAVIRTADNTVTARIPAPVDAWELLMLPGGEYLYIGDDRNVLVIRTADNSILGEISCRRHELVLSSDGQHVYRADGSVLVISTSSHQVVDSIDVLVDAIAAHPGGDYLYGTEAECVASVFVVSLEERRIIDTLPGGTHLLDLLAHPYGDRVYCVGEDGLFVYGYSSRMRPPRGGDRGK